MKPQTDLIVYDIVMNALWGIQQTYHQVPTEIWFVDCRHLHVKLLEQAPSLTIFFEIVDDRYYDTFRGIRLVDHYSRHDPVPPYPFGAPGVYAVFEDGDWIGIASV